MFIEPTITWVPSGFSGYIWLDTKIVLKKKIYRFDSNNVESCKDKYAAQCNITMNHQEPSLVYDNNNMQDQHRSFGVQDARSSNCLGCAQFKLEDVADHTCVAPGRIKRTEFNLRNTVAIVRNQEPQKKLFSVLLQIA